MSQFGQPIMINPSTFSSNFELDPNLSDKEKDIIRLRAKMFNPEFYKQEQQNQIEKAYEMLGMYKVLYNIENEIRKAQYTLKQGRE